MIIMHDTNITPPPMCKLCKSAEVEIEFTGPIRHGRPGSILSEDVHVCRCKACGVIFHDFKTDLKNYYESAAYRESREGTTDIENYYRLHDGENLNKFKITGTGIFRGRTVADIGCGGGGFLDFLAGVASRIVAIEPSQAYRLAMDKKGYHTFAYARDAFPFYKGKIDVITSFDVIEHVDDPVDFFRDVFALLADGGQAVIATPTEMPVLREFAGKNFDQGYLFYADHPWIFNRQSLEYAAREAGFADIKFDYLQRYGLGNFVSWLQTGKPKGNVVYESLPHTLNAVFSASLEEQGKADYIIARLGK